MARNLKNLVKLVNKATEQMPIEKAFLQDLKRSIELTASKNRGSGSRTYKPSAMHCIRQMAYIIYGKPVDETPESYMSIGICNSGTDTHQRIQQAVLDMKSNGMNCEYINVADFVRSRNLDYLEIKQEPDFEHGSYETKLYHKTLNMSFLCDGIIKYMGKYYILELKTENANKFYNRESVNPDHFNQGTAYSIALGIDDVLFVYINRDTSDMKSFMFTPSDEMKQDLVGLISNCDSYIKKLKIPPKPLNISKKACEYCAFKTQCRKDG